MKRPKGCMSCRERGPLMFIDSNGELGGVLDEGKYEFPKTELKEEDKEKLEKIKVAVKSEKPIIDAPAKKELNFIQKIIKGLSLCSRQERAEIQSLNNQKNTELNEERSNANQKKFFRNALRSYPPICIIAEMSM